MPLCSNEEAVTRGETLGEISRERCQVSITGVLPIGPVGAFLWGFGVADRNNVARPDMRSAPVPSGAGEQISQLGAVV